MAVIVSSPSDVRGHDGPGHQVRSDERRAGTTARSTSRRQQEQVEDDDGDPADAGGAPTGEQERSGGHLAGHEQAARTPPVTPSRWTAQPVADEAEEPVVREVRGRPVGRRRPAQMDAAHHQEEGPRPRCGPGRTVLTVDERSAAVALPRSTVTGFPFEGGGSWWIRSEPRSAGRSAWLTGPMVPTSGALVVRRGGPRRPRGRCRRRGRATARRRNPRARSASTVPSVTSASQSPRPTEASMASDLAGEVVVGASQDAHDVAAAEHADQPVGRGRRPERSSPWSW